MNNSVSYSKLSKKAKREQDLKKRNYWVTSPVSKIVESKKVYNRKKAQKEIRNSSVLYLYSISIILDFLFSPTTTITPHAIIKTTIDMKLPSIPNPAS